MAALRTRTLSTALTAAALTLLLAAPVAAQETIAHLIVEVIKGDDGDVMGYRIHHEKHHAIYVAMLAPGGAGLRRCAVAASERLEVTEGDGPAAYFDGSDGEPCYLSVFAPDTGESSPPGRPPVLPSHPCPTCPSR